MSSSPPPSGSPPPSFRDSGLDFPDLFQSFNNADAALGYGFTPNPTPITVSSPPVMPDQTTHSLSQILGCSLNMDILGPSLKKSIGPLLITDDAPFPMPEPFDGTSLLTDIQLLQRNFGIFNDALGVINSQDVVVKKVVEMKLLVQLKIGGLWAKGVIVHPCVEGSEEDEIKKLGSDYGITVQ